MKGDDGAYQISTNPVPLQMGQQIILTWWAVGDTSSDAQGTNPTDPMQIIGIITATNANVSQNDPFLQHHRRFNFKAMGFLMAGCNTRSPIQSPLRTPTNILVFSSIPERWGRTLQAFLRIMTISPCMWCPSAVCPSL